MTRPLILACALALATAGVPAPAGAQPAEAVEVRIARDGYGVPHVYSDTLEGVAYGAGYAITVDRLFQMDVLRALAKGRASELFGRPVFGAADRTQRTIGYTEDELRAKLTRLSLTIQRMYAAYVDGVNARIDEVNGNPSLLPMEYVELGLGRPAPWTTTDSLAIADMLVETFGAGGGSELSQARLLQSLLERYQDTTEAVAAFSDVRWINDPAAPVSIPPDYDWRAAPSRATDLPPKSWRRDARLGLTDAQRKPVAAAPAEATAGGPQIGTLAQVGLVPDQPSDASTAELESFTRGMAQLREIVQFGSNAFVTGPSRTAGGGTVQLGGPQVGQYAPQIIAEFGLHSPAHNLDMVGLTFAGSGPAVLIGRTPFFAWTTTTGNSDGGDIYVERLGPEPETYVYEGAVERMDCRDEHIRDRNGAPGETVRICRTRHGPVLATDAENGVAYALRRAWFDHETGTIEGFFGANFVTTIDQFATSVNRLQSNHNMFYVDAAGNYGYWHPGAIPVRADGTDVRLPQDGRFAATDWRRMRTADEMPHAVNFPRAWLANWNNKPAVDWDNGDGANYGAVFRSHMWNELLAADPAMSRTKGEELNKINATTELEFAFFRDHIVAAGAASDDDRVRAAAAALAAWDARRIDEDDDGLVDSEPGYSLWKGWRALAREMAFADDLGDYLGAASDSMLLHALEGQDASLPPSRDYLGKPAVEFLNEVMAANLDALEQEYETPDMAQWRASMPTQFYTRLNVRFYDCTVARAVGGPTIACDDRLPGNVRDLDYMNRGTYNHLVEFRPGSEAGLPRAEDTGPIVEQRDGYVVEAESIISPGQSGFINSAGVQDAHYEDQHELYASFTYKPMPLAEADVVALGGPATARSYTFDLDGQARHAGGDRIGTAVVASSATFERAETIVIAAAGDFPDALAAAPLAAKHAAPLLLVGASLDPRVRDEIARLGATAALVVGGRAAVSDQVLAELADAGAEPRRIAGPTRYATAAAVATEVAGEAAPGGEAFVASGRSFADALSAGSVAGVLGLPILLVEPGSIPAETRAALEDLGVDAPLVLGGEAAVSAAVLDELGEGARRLAGDDRYATSVVVAAFGIERGLAADQVHVATGTDFPDGLAAGATAAAGRAVLVLVHGGDPSLADPGYAFVARHHEAVATTVVYGGQAAVSSAAAARVQLAASQR